MDWRSHRVRRVCRSTLAAETMAMDEATQAAIDDPAKWPLVSECVALGHVKQPSGVTCSCHRRTKAGMRRACSAKATRR